MYLMHVNYYYFSFDQKEMRAVSSQTGGTVTIINVGQPVYPLVMLFVI